MSVTTFSDVPCRWWFRGKLLHTPEYRKAMSLVAKALLNGGAVEFSTKIVQHRPDIYGYKWDTGHMCVHETFSATIEIPDAAQVAR